MKNTIFRFLYPKYYTLLHTLQTENDQLIKLITRMSSNPTAKDIKMIQGLIANANKTRKENSGESKSFQEN